jgi:hypothetical protein
MGGNRSDPVIPQLAAKIKREANASLLWIFYLKLLFIW